MRPSPGPASHFKTISCVLFFLHLHQLLQVSFSFASNFHLSFSKQVPMNLYDAVSDVVESLGISIPLHHRLKDNHQLQIALLLSSVSIELVSEPSEISRSRKISWDFALDFVSKRLENRDRERKNLDLVSKNEIRKAKISISSRKTR